MTNYCVKTGEWRAVASPQY